MKTLTAVYDFAAAPASYDFMSFLCTTGIAAELGGCQAIHILFVPADTEDGWRLDPKPISAAQKAWRRDNLIVPLCKLIGATHTICHSREQAKALIQEPTWPAHYDLAKPCSAYWQGNLMKMTKYSSLPKFTSDPEAVRMVESAVKGPFITITRRNTTYGDSRNSNLFAWDAFKNAMKMNGDLPIIEIPDTEEAHEFSGIAALAAINPLIRHALYSKAEMNLGVNTGPMALCYYTGLPCLIFKLVADYYSTTPEFFKRAGIPVGSQYPWSGPKQRMIWEDDNFPVIMNAYQETMRDSRKVA